MAIIANGIDLDNTQRSLNINGVEINEVVANGITVWKYDDQSAPPPPNEPPGDFSSFTVQCSNADREVNMEWSFVTGYPAPRYKVFRNDNEIADLSNTVNTYTDTSPLDGENNYTIAAYNSFEGNDYHTLSDTETCNIISAPKITTFNASDSLEGYIEISWSIDGNYDLITLYRDNTVISTNPSQPYKDYSVSDSTTYTYKLVVSNDAGSDEATDTGYALPGEPSLAPPTAPTNFNASYLLLEQIKITFNGSSGNPTPTYNLVDEYDTTVYYYNVTSGSTYNFSPNSYKLKVKAVNSEGSASSNTSTGWSCEAGSPVQNFNGTIDESGTIEFIWDNSATGFPTVKYNLYKDGNKFVSDISSPYFMEHNSTEPADYQIETEVSSFGVVVDTRLSNVVTIEPLEGIVINTFTVSFNPDTDTATLNWSYDNGPPATGSYVTRNNGEVTYNFEGDITSWNDTNVPSGVHEYTLYLEDANGANDTRTIELDISNPIPDVPLNFRFDASASDSNSVIFDWDQIPSHPNFLRYECVITNVHDSSEIYTKETTLTSSGISNSSDSACHGERYTGKVRAIGSEGNSDWSNSDTGIIDALKPAPDSFEIANVSETSVTFSYPANSKCNKLDFACFINTTNERRNIPYDNSSFTWTGLSPETSYTFTIKKIGEDINGNEVLGNAKTLQVTTPASFTRVTIDYNDCYGDCSFVSGGNGSWTFNPPHAGNYNVCLVGGGGSGAASQDSDTVAGGGHNGNPTSQTINLSSSVSVGIGLGGSAPTHSETAKPGVSGGSTTFGTLTANGGTGGSIGSFNYNGEGNSITTCLGTNNDGGFQYFPVEYGKRASGGQSSGVSEGGGGISHADQPITAGNGGTGSGGGGCNTNSDLAIAGNGGNGRVVITNPNYLKWLEEQTEEIQAFSHDKLKVMYNQYIRREDGTV